MSDDLVKLARSQIGDDVQVIVDRDALLERLAARIEALTAENAKLRTQDDDIKAIFNADAKRISALEAENAKLREAAEWQPIETAPKDGAEILVFSYGDVSLACFVGGGWVAWADGHPVHDTAGDAVCLLPSHWRKRPEPPK